jgi:hypothetical protein
MNWEKGFEAGVAFTLRHFTSNGVSPTDISHFIMELEHLRMWKTHEEWRKLVEKNIVLAEENNG